MLPINLQVQGKQLQVQLNLIHDVMEYCLFHKSLKVQGSLKPLKSTIGHVLLAVQKGTASLYYCNFTNVRCFRWSMILPKLKRHRNAKNTLNDHNGIHGHRNLIETEGSVIARNRNFNALKICKITACLFFNGISLCMGLNTSYSWK